MLVGLLLEDISHVMVQPQQLQWMMIQLYEASVLKDITVLKALKHQLPVPLVHMGKLFENVL